MKQTLIALLLLFTSGIAMADGLQHAIDIKNDKIVINTDSLDLPGSTSAYEVLTLLPDLVDRTKTYILQNYDIQINGKSVGNARDAVLEQIRLSDLKCIEVSDNSLSNVSSMGASGSISLELRSATREWKGAVNAEASNLADYSGGLRLEHKSNKWIFHGVATAENYVPKSFHSSAFLNNEATPSTSYDKKTPEFSEFVAAFLEYRPNKHDLFKITASETYSNYRTNQFNYGANGIFSDEQYSRTRNVNASFALNYEHLFDSGSKICAEANYRFVPENYDGYDVTQDSKVYNEYSHKAHNIFGELKLEQPLMHKTATRSAKMELGTQYNIVLAKDEKDCFLPELSFDADENTYYLRPFGKVEATFGKWQFMANVDYQHFSYDIKLKQDEMGNPHHRENCTGQAVVMYSPNKRNLLRLRYIRSIDRPGAEQLYPYVFYNPKERQFICGNSDLEVMRQNALDLDYSLDLSSSDYHLELKTSVEYSHSFDEICTYMDAKSNYISYTNLGKSDVVLGDVGAYFRKSVFSLWFSGNVYHKMDDLDEDGKTDHYTYYNLLLRPVVDLPHRWMISVHAVYNSAIKTSSYRESEMFYGGLRVSKKWRHFGAYIYGILNFLGNSKFEATTIVDGKEIPYLRIYENMHSHFGGGVRYNF